MIIKHYYDFGEAINDQIGKDGGGLTQSAWDLLRTESEDKAFAFVESDKETYADMCAGRMDCRNMAHEILDMMGRNRMNDRIVSLGCGKGILEWNLKNLKPNLHIECTDYTSKGIKVLKEVFPECDEIYEFDMLNASHYQKIRQKDQVLLLYRVSTEFDFQTWKKIFQDIYQNDFRYILFVPTEICTLKIAWNELKRYVYHLLKGEGRVKNVFCGYLYSKKVFEKMWKDYFKIKEGKKVGDTIIYLLERSDDKRAEN